MCSPVELLTPEQRALKQLVDCGLRFAVLRQPSSWVEAGDIDIVVYDAGEADRLLVSLDYIQFSERLSSRNYQRYDRLLERWIHLDVKSAITLGAFESPRDFIDSILGSSHFSDDGIPYLNPVDEAILLLFHAANDKERIDPKYRERMFIDDMDMVSDRADLYNFLPKPLSEYWRWIEAVDRGIISQKTAIMEIRKSFGIMSTQRKTLASRVFQRIKTIIFFGPRPIVFLGPDGAGKSTLTEPLEKLHWPSLRCQYMGPSRFAEMRAIFVLPMRMFDKLRNLYSSRNIIGLFARSGWQFVCYFDFLERYGRHLWFWAGHGIVIFDRFACDMYFRKPSRWNEIIFLKMFPRPRFVFLCVGEPEAIHQRKPELTQLQISSTIELYRKKLAQYDIPYIEINTTDLSPDDALTQVVKHLVANGWFWNS